MQSPVSGRESSKPTIQTSPRFAGRLGFLYGALVLVGLILPATAFGSAEPENTLTVLVYSYSGASPATLRSAEREADKILNAAGASIEWVNCWDKKQLNAESGELCDKGWTSQTPGLRLISGTDKHVAAEFGVASIPVYATIYYDKVARRAHNDDSAAELPVLLGCVIAHELGHLLLGSPGHYKFGIMQAQWGADQIRRALTGRLLFTKEQERIIREQLLTATNR